MNFHYALSVAALIVVSSLSHGQDPATATPPPVAIGKDLSITGWAVLGDKAKTFGPAEEEGKITFTGPDFGKKGKQIAAFFPKTELAEGQSLELSAKVNFTGVSGMGNFRYGVFQKRSRDHSRGWLGYCAYTGIDKKFPKGGLYASDPGNDVSFDQATSRVLGVTLVPFKNIKDGAYQIKMSLKLVGTSIQSSAALSSIGSQVVEFARYDGTDTQPSTTSFDALGFTTHELLSADSFSLSEVSVKLVGP